MDGRRPLRFSRLSEVMPEVDRLLTGHRLVGQWTLGQVCNHLSTSIIGSIEGTSFRFPWLLRKTIGPMLVRRIIETGRMPRGIKAPPTLQPRPGLDDRAEAEALRATVNYFGMHSGPLADHPLGGPIGRDAWDRFHAVHCAHHLSYLLPGSGEAG
jgi:hypothetical protein